MSLEKNDFVFVRRENNDSLSRNILEMLNDKSETVSLVEFYFFSSYQGRGLCAYIHDVQTGENYRGKGYATKLVKMAVNLAKEKGCYRIFLNCSEEHVPFYEKCGMQRWQPTMAVMF